MLLADKYKPGNSTQLRGVEYATMAVLGFLRSWNTPQRQFRAVMLSGPPGIGKTTLAELACKESNLPNVLRVDSSRKRSKKALDEVESAFTSRKIDAYITGKMQRSRPGAVIIDELDAMLVGGQDRGGVARMVSFIKQTMVPVICICNDAGERSLKTLLSLCMHVRMQRPTVDAIAARLVEVARAEGLSQSSFSIERAKQMARRSGCDVRQALNELQFYRVLPAAATSQADLNVDRAFNPFDVANCLFGCRPADAVKWGSALYETDRMLAPMLVHENYHKVSGLQMAAAADIADAISAGDVVNSMSAPIMPDVRAFATCAWPCQFAKGRLNGRVDFPVALGKCSTEAKNARSISALSKCSDTRAYAMEIRPTLGVLLVSAPNSAKATAEAATRAGVSRLEWDMICDCCIGRAPTAAARVAIAKAMMRPGKRGRPAKRQRVAEPQKKECKEEEEEEEEEEEKEDNDDIWV